MEKKNVIEKLPYETAEVEVVEIEKNDVLDISNENDAGWI